MTREEKQKAIDALKMSAPVMAVTQEEFNNYIQILNQVMDWLEQQPCDDWCDVPSDEMTLGQARQAVKDLRKKLREYLDQEPCEMTIEEYRQRMIDTFHNADCDELIAVVVRPEESEFKQLEWLLKNHYHNQKQQPCEDAISRQAVLNIIMPYCKDDDGSIENTGDLRNALDDIESLPPVIPQPKTAHWINKTLIYKAETEGERDCYAGTCSACGGVQECWNYCGGCGARMVSE